MIEKIILDMLTADSVSILKQNYIEYQGQMYPTGQPYRKAYINSESGRSEVKNELPKPQQDAIFSVWGTSPTIDLEV